MLPATSITTFCLRVFYLTKIELSSVFSKKSDKTVKIIFVLTRKGKVLKYQYYRRVSRGGKIGDRVAR